MPQTPRPGRLRAAPLLVALGLGPGLVACTDSSGPLDTPPDGDWPVASPAQVGLAEAPLLELIADVGQGRYGDVHSVLVVRHGLLAFEAYFGEGDRERLHRMYSVTKSVAATLVGVAWDRGLIPDLDRPLVAFFPEYGTLGNPGGGKDAITLRHALRMRTGLAWNEWATNYSDPTNPTTALVQSDDWMKFVLDLPMEAPPGSRFVYNSGVSMLLSGVLRNATGMRVANFADQALFGPLGIRERGWWTGPGDIDNTGWGLHLRSRDMARIGQLYLQGGVWEGERLLSEAWIAASWEAATRFVDGGGYGYQWWLGAPAPGVGAVPAARGWGGQFIVVVPALDAVVVTTQGNFDGVRGLDPARLVEVLSDAARGAAVP